MHLLECLRVVQCPLLGFDVIEIGEPLQVSTPR